MSLELRVEQHFKQTYADNVMMVAQQRRNPFMAAVTEVSCTGEAHSAADLVGKAEAEEVDGRNRRNQETVPERTRRWLVMPNKWIRSGQYIDKVDVLRQAMDPTSTLVQAHTAGVIRRVADRIVGIQKNDSGAFELRDGGILGAAVEGKSAGGTKKTLPDKCFEPVATSGLTLQKLMNTKERLNKDDFGLEDDDPLYAAITPRQVTDLLQLADGNGESLNAFSQLQLRTGVPTTLLGMTWIVTNRLPKFTDDRWCPVWSKRNIVAGWWEQINGSIWNDTAADNTPYARVRAMLDVVRIEDAGVHVIVCKE